MMRRKRALDILDQQIRDHLDEETRQNIERGMSPDEARFAARRTFGSSALVKEDARSVWIPVWFEQLIQDARLGLRSLRRTPGFTAVAVLTLALGIGANTAIFSLINSLLLRPLPVRQPEQLVLVADPANGLDLPPGVPNLQSFMWSYRMWDQIHQRSQLFDGTFAHFYSRFNLASGGETEFVDGLYASGAFFDTLGVAPILGRALTGADDHRGGGAAGPVAVVSHGFWQRRFSGAADVLGRKLTIDRVAFTVVGVLPPGFTGPVAGRNFDVAIPVGTVSLVRGPQFLDHPGVNWLTIMARLKPGQTVEAATAALRGVQSQIREASLPPGPSNRTDAYLKSPLALLPAGRGNPLAPLRVRSERPLNILQLTVALVLVIACVNIANLTLARATARRHEISVRLALGASRWRLSRQLFVESLLLGSLGAAGGLLFAQWGTPVLVHALSTDSNAVALKLAPDARVLLFTAIVAVAACVVFGMIPAARSTQVEPIESLKRQSSTIGAQVNLASGFVIAQVALSLVLVVSGGLLIRTYANLAVKDLGFDPAGMLVVDVNALKARVPPANRLVVFDEIRRVVGAVPGVADAAVADMTPVTGGAMVGDVEVPGVPLPRGRGETFFNRVSPGWLSLYRTPIRAGRDFTDADREGSRRVAIVNQAFARKFLNGADALGRTVRQMQGPPGHAPMEWEIIGVTGDATYDSMRAQAPPTLYVAFDQIDRDLVAVAAPTSASVSLRAAVAPPTVLIQSVAAAVAKVNPELDLTFRRLPDVVSGSISLERTLAILSGFFGALALLLAVVGLYGVTSYTVSRRRTEIGIRMALGATPALVVRQVLSRVLMLVAAGIAIGAVTSVWASRFMAVLLYGLTPRDPLTLIGGALVLAAVGTVAGWRPAWRASRVDPMLALRCE